MGKNEENKYSFFEGYIDELRLYEKKITKE